MFKRTHWFNVMFISALLLGMLPATGSNAALTAAQLPPEDARAFQSAAGPAPPVFGPSAAPSRLVSKAPTALTDIPLNVPDNRGTEFWLTFPMNHDGVGNTLELFITSHTDTTGTVAIPGLTFSEAFTVTAGQIITVAIPAGAEIVESDVVQDKGIHVTATAEITVYGLTFDEEAGVGVTSDAYLGLPTDVLDTDYLVLGYETDDNVDVPGSQFALVGTQDNTTVVITPTIDTWSGTTGRYAGEVYQITLNQGQTYLLYADQFYGDDLSGTPIHADKPIAVFGGNRCANIPYGYEACDTLVEQLSPTRAWGKEFATVPLASRSYGDTFRVLAAQSNTRVWINGTEIPVALARGEFYEKVLTTTAHITATKPVLVAQYSNGQIYDGSTSDPFMMLIPPFEQFQGAYVVNTPASGFPRNYLNVVAHTHVITDVFLDGAPITSTLFQTIGTSRFSGAQVSVTLGTHQLTGTLPFGVFAYGFVDYGSYGYPGGGALGPIADVATLTLTLPPGDTLYVDTHYCISATVSDAGGSPVPGVRVDFDVTGKHPQQSFGVSNAQGQVPICYTGTQVGFDTLVASVGTLFDSALVEWITGTPPPNYTLTISKTAEEMSAPPLLVHDQIQYTIRVTNTTTGTLTNLRITDTLPAGVTYFRTPKGSPRPVQTGTPTVWELASLAAGQSQTYKVIVKVDGTANPIGCNYAAANSAETASVTAGPVCLGTGDVDTGLELLKTATDINGAPLLVNDLVRYDITITNTHPVSTITELLITETVPAGLVFESATPIGNGTNPVTWTHASLAPSAVWTATVLLRVDGSTALIGSNIVTVTSRQQSETATDPVPPPPGPADKLIISKTAEEMSAPPLLVNDRILYTIRVTNTSTGTLTNLIVTDTLPAGVTYFGIPTGSPRPAQTGNPVVWTLPSLAAGASQTFKVIVKVDGTADPIGCNYADANSTETVPVTAGPICLGTGDVETGLELLKTATDVNGAPLLVDDLVRYDVRITNTHPVSTMTELLITETVPAGLVFESATPIGNGTNPVTWTHASLAPSAVWTATVLLRVDGSTNLIGSNVVTVTSRQQSETATDPVPPPPGPDKLIISKTAQEMSEAPLLVNDRILYTIRVTNTSTGTLTGLIVTDTLPAGVTYFGIPKGSPRPAQTGNPVVWTQVSLDAGVVKIYKVIVKVDGTTNPIGENVAQATCAEETLPAAASAQVPGDGTHAPGLVVTGTVQGGGTTLQAVRAPASALDVGDTFTYTLTATNSNPTLTMNNVVVSVTLPSGASLESATPTGYTGVLTLTWTLPTLGPEANWQATLVVSQTANSIGSLLLAAASDEQSPVGMMIALSSSRYQVYLPLVMR